MEVKVRSRLLAGETGDRARVSRVMRSGDCLFVEVEQTEDAKEPTVMVAVNEALKAYEEEHGIVLEQ
jgi:seryl-tRNA(Sec) selenium transferase